MSETEADLDDLGIDVAHIRRPDGTCVLSLNGQGHLPCGTHNAPAPAGDSGGERG
jgi:hypothetical protein